MIVGAKCKGGQPVYCLKWLGYPHSENCEGDVTDPAEFLVNNGKEMVGHKIKVIYSAMARWQAGVISGFNSETSSHVIKYDLDSEESELDLLKPQKEWKLIGI